MKKSRIITSWARGKSGRLKKSLYSSLGKCEGKRQLGKHKHIWENNLKIGLKYMLEAEHHIYLIDTGISEG